MISPRLCRAVECIAMPGLDSVVTHPPLRLGAGAENHPAYQGNPEGTGKPGKTAGQGNRTPQERLSAPLTGFEDRARHQPGTSRRARM